MDVLALTKEKGGKVYPFSDHAVSLLHQQPRACSDGLSAQVHGGPLCRSELESL